MGIWQRALTSIGLRRPSQKADTSDAFGASIGGGFSQSFSSFNNQKQQLQAYVEWVYVATRAIAEHCAAIDLRIFLNNTKVGNGAMSSKLIEHPTEARKYLSKRVNAFTFTNGQVVYRKDVPALEELENHPLLELLNAPNAFMTKNEFFEITFLHLELTGDAFWLVGRDKKGVPIELWPLMPNLIQVVPDKEKFIIGYIYNVNGEQVPFDPDDIIHHKYGNPMDFRRGYSAVQAAARPIDTDAHAADFNRKFFYNSATPDGVITTDSTLDEKTWLRLKQEWADTYGGTGNAHRTAILEAGLDYKSVQINQRDMEFLKGRVFNRDQILAMFGVPKSVVGLDESMSRANAETVEYVFTKRNRTKMQRLVNRITADLAIQFDAHLVLSFTDPVPEDKLFLLEETKAATGGIAWQTINEERAKRGDDPIEGGDAIYINGQMVPLGVASKILPPQEIAAVAEEDEDKPNLDDSTPETDEDDNDNSTADTSGSTGSETTNDSGSQASITSGVVEKSTTITITPFTDFKNLPEFPSALFEAESKKKDTEPQIADEKPQLKVNAELESFLFKRARLVMGFEKMTLRAASERFHEQRLEVLANLHQRFPSPGQESRAIKKDNKKKLNNLFNQVKSQTIWQALLIPIYTKLSLDAGNASMDLVNNPTKYGYTGPDPEEPFTYDNNTDAINKFFSQRSGVVSKGIDSETDKQLRATLTEGLNNGEDLQQLADRVENVYGAASGYRALRIARTESQQALHFSSQQAWDQSGVVEKYIWLVGSDPCAICAPFADQTADSPDDFADGAPTLHPNCTCDTVPYDIRTADLMPKSATDNSDTEE